MMSKLVFLLFLIFSLNVHAEVDTPSIEVSTIQIAQLFDENVVQIDIKKLPNLVEREEKIESCVADYIKKQSRTYSAIVQNNLYDLLFNFERVIPRLYGKKQEADKVLLADKIEALARLQCEVYYSIRAIK